MDLPGFHGTGDEYHSIGCGKYEVMLAIELVKCKDRLKENPKPDV